MLSLLVSSQVTRFAVVNLRQSVERDEAAFRHQHRTVCYTTVFNFSSLPDVLYAAAER